ncbi:acyl-CoA dehydrogenase family protein [Reyranella sp. CPCC 100927]|uniref:acyl-CoA dehydrogenase family protein n=1 Tax=Reyranella sp. CPCC 100927 TaxID=2599616 RepID=UPI0011B6EA42|nr:acyl-CoA dehydrogenase family protein [Reyranella sp. CPCC 100927]TWS96582.1 acyl-CoA dehydrogenase [Reyranella sp. CPCC 100927]
MWSFETDPDYQEKLDWVTRFVKEEVEPLDHLGVQTYDVRNEKRNKAVKPLQAEVRRQGLWACHLGSELGGQGYGQVKLGLLNEILGRSRFGPIVFGCQAPDSGNAEILAHYGTAEQKRKYLKPLLDNEIVSCFSMTEPQGGADPKVFTCRAELDGDQWVINGEKWFSSHAHLASFLIVMAVTDPQAPPYRRLSQFIVPAETPGIEMIRNMPVGHHAQPGHAYLRYNNVRIPRDHMLGERGDGFVVAQTRLGGGRIHHAMRTIGQVKKSFDMMCERVLSRETQGSLLADKQMVQEKIADSWMEIEQFRLLVLQTAWKIDKYKDYRQVRKDISAVKALMPKVFHDVAARALHLHGSLGVTPDMPFAEQVIESFHMGLADGPTEVHKITVARQVLRDYHGTNQLFPTQYGPHLREAAIAKLGDLIESEVAAA